MTFIETLPKPSEDQAAQDLIRSIPIPPRPSLLIQLQREMRRDTPDFKVISSLIAQDAALSGALLKTANSALFSLRRKVESIRDALSALGLRQVMMLVHGFLVRRSFAANHCALLNFWERSSKRALVMTFLARKLRLSSPDQAHAFGLFSDLGIPMLLQRFDAYQETLQLAQDSAEQTLVMLEEQRHRTNHAVIGALLAHNWTLPADLVMAIRLHHDYSIFEQNQLPLEVKHLISLGIISDSIIQLFQGVGEELRLAQALAMEELGLADDELEDLSYDIGKMLVSEG